MDGVLQALHDCGKKHPKLSDTLSEQSIMALTLLFFIGGKKIQMDTDEMTLLLDGFEKKNKNEELGKFLNLLILPSPGPSDLKQLEMSSVALAQYSQLDELKLALFTLQYKSGYLPVNTSSRSSSEQWISYCQNILLTSSKLNINYLDFIQTCKIEILLNKLKHLEESQKWSLYLTTSYTIIKEAVLDIDSTSFLKSWYLDQDILSTIQPNFLKSLLLEPYGYLKQTILTSLKTYLKSSPTANNYDNWELLKIIPDKQFVKFTRGNIAIVKQLIDASDFNTAIQNLIDLNIIVALKRFKTIRFSTFIKLCEFEDIVYKISDLIDSVTKLSLGKKINVEIDQADEILIVPSHERSTSDKLNDMFSNVLPNTLERDWDALLDIS